MSEESSTELTSNRRVELVIEDTSLFKKFDSFMRNLHCSSIKFEFHKDQIYICASDPPNNYIQMQVTLWPASLKSYTCTEPTFAVVNYYDFELATRFLDKTHATITLYINSDDSYNKMDKYLYVESRNCGIKRLSKLEILNTNKHMRAEPNLQDDFIVYELETKLFKRAINYKAKKSMNIRFNAASNCVSAVLFKDLSEASYIFFEGNVIMRSLDFNDIKKIIPLYLVQQCLRNNISKEIQLQFTNDETIFRYVLNEFDNEIKFTIKNLEYSPERMPQ